MTDNLSKADRHRTMMAVKGSRTGLERRVHGMLAGRRFRGWEANPAGVIGNPDLVFTAQRVAVFIDGCFWHGCPFCERPLPRSNRVYWKGKIEGNRRRDKSLRARLRRRGWKVVGIWEHQLRHDGGLEDVASRIRRAV